MTLMSRLFKATGITLACAMTLSVAAQNLIVPQRDVPRPKTTNSVPHMQIGVSHNPAISEELIRRADAMRGVSIRPTVISIPGAWAFWLDDDLDVARPKSIVAGREFAHIHPDGSLHASLSPELAKAATDAGWAIPHPWSDEREGWEGFVMIYTPQDQDELEIVVDLVARSYEYVTGASPY
ncbi:MAG: luciferase family protein [Pseudomonadota bacterium]